MYINADAFDGRGDFGLMGQLRPPGLRAASFATSRKRRLDALGGGRAGFGPVEVPSLFASAGCCGGGKAESQLESRLDSSTAASLLAIEEGRRGRAAEEASTASASGSVGTADSTSSRLLPVGRMLATALMLVFSALRREARELRLQERLCL